MMRRRTFLNGALGTAAIAAAGHARIALASVPIDQRLVVVILRGGADGLDIVPPVADPRYRALRPRIAVPPPGTEGGALALGDGFGLHPALAPIHPLWGADELLVMQAATTPYRKRSHFDGQNVLENGSEAPFGLRDGWLNRALLRLNDGDRRPGLSLGFAIPLILRGDAGVQAWAPHGMKNVVSKPGADFMARLAAVYEGDHMFDEALRLARASEATMGDMSGIAPGKGPGRKYVMLCEAAGRILARPKSARIAVVEYGGWDTHTNQPGRLNRQLEGLARGLSTLKDGLGPAWSKTAIVIVSEFGRTAAENGTRGTDHGVGGIAMVLGGAVRGGRIAGAWPGLAESALHKRRDVAPANDYRSLFKTVLHDHIGLPEGYIEDRVFPASRGIAPLDGLIRRT